MKIKWEYVVAIVSLVFSAGMAYASFRYEPRIAVLEKVIEFIHEDLDLIKSKLNLPSHDEIKAFNERSSFDG